MNKHRLQRTNAEDLTFSGQRIATVNDRYRPGNHTSWLDLALYRTELGSYVLGTTLHIFEEPNRSKLSGAVVFATGRELIDFLQAEGKDLGGLLDSLVERAARVDHVLCGLLGSDLPHRRTRVA
ncbi:MAG: hypothetical protein ACOCWT_04930, partial [Desulfohalobiaceae bacterium]